MQTVDVLIDGKHSQLEVNQMNPEWYDSIYSHESQYRGSPEDSPYFPVWEKIIEKIGDMERVADFGCGPGQFAELLIRRDKWFVLGADFSPKAIEMAEFRISHAPVYFTVPKGRFWLTDLYKPWTYSIVKFDCAIFSEVLEHLEHDLVPLNFLPSNTHVIFSVPSYYTQSHLRVFERAEEIIDHYGKVIDIKDINMVWMDKDKDYRIYVVDGRKI